MFRVFRPILTTREHYLSNRLARFQAFNAQQYCLTSNLLCY